MTHPTSGGQSPTFPTALLSSRYVLERELGRGGMATVYLARETKHERQVAIKVLHPEVSAASARSDSFARLASRRGCRIPISSR